MKIVITMILMKRKIASVFLYFLFSLFFNNVKAWYVYTVEYYTAERKKEPIPSVTAWMELETIMLSEISQAVKDKYHMISPIRET